MMMVLVFDDAPELHGGAGWKTEKLVVVDTLASDSECVSTCCNEMDERRLLADDGVADCSAVVELGVCGGVATAHDVSRGVEADGPEGAGHGGFGNSSRQTGRRGRHAGFAHGIERSNAQSVCALQRSSILRAPNGWGMII